MRNNIVHGCSVGYSAELRKGRKRYRTFGIIFPFVLGGIIAFILNIPMRAIEKLLFKSKNGKQKKYARPLSMIITFLLVIGVIAGVILIVVPQIGGTVRELTKSAEAFFPKVQKWAEDMF